MDRSAVGVPKERNEFVAEDVNIDSCEWGWGCLWYLHENDLII